MIEKRNKAGSIKNLGDGYKTASIYKNTSLSNTFKKRRNEHVEAEKLLISNKIMDVNEIRHSLDTRCRILDSTKFCLKKGYKITNRNLRTGSWNFRHGVSMGEQPRSVKNLSKE